MEQTPPYDDDRAAYTRHALARLVLADHATDVADAAAGLVGTRNDADTGPGGRAGQARQLVELAEQVLASAVVHEVERGSSWAEIGHYLGIGANEARERFAPALKGWDTAFEEPYRLDTTGRKRIPQLPTAAYDPASACRRLDLWAFLHLTGVNDRNAVSAALLTTDGGPDA
ncbi:hypothetical protein [Kitasatospora aureofaciens]|uniref:hypothetical protein n=1 Tax=Kitasatospora aureofaciens TaxID=1894 RepID=UPI0037FDA381